ncbi:MAG: glycosyltransferase [Sphingomonadaceae bacterium]
MLAVTVAICTAGERRTLEGTVRSLLVQVPTIAAKHQILVVDNSRVDTGFVRRVVDAAAMHSPIPVRYTREARPGLGFARNAAIAAAEGEIVAFVDDDVVADPSWLLELVRAYRETGAAAVGGRIYPIWESRRPPWLGDQLLGFLSIVDYGPDRRRCQYPNYPFGANISFRRDLLLKLGGFATGLGGGGAPTYLMDEFELCRRVERAGGAILYAPSAVVGHIVPASRLSKSFFLKRAVNLGRANARMALSETDAFSRAAAAKGLLLAAGRVLRHGARASLLSVARRECESLSESRHLAWNLAWMWETTLLALGRA